MSRSLTQISWQDKNFNNKGYFNVKHISQSAPCTTNYI